LGETSYSGQAHQNPQLQVQARRTCSPARKNLGAQTVLPPMLHPASTANLASAPGDNQRKARRISATTFTVVTLRIRAWREVWDRNPQFPAVAECVGAQPEEHGFTGI